MQALCRLLAHAGVMSLHNACMRRLLEKPDLLLWRCRQAVSQAASQHKEFLPACQQLWQIGK